MFGLRAFYRASVIFAMLPDKRAFENPKTLAYKLTGKWQSFELNDQHDIDEALAHLNRAYAKAAR